MSCSNKFWLETKVKLLYNFIIPKEVFVTALYRVSAMLCRIPAVLYRMPEDVPQHRVDFSAKRLRHGYKAPVHINHMNQVIRHPRATIGRWL